MVKKVFFSGSCNGDYLPRITINNYRPNRMPENLAELPDNPGPVSSDPENTTIRHFICSSIPEKPIVTMILLKVTRNCRRNYYWSPLLGESCTVLRQGISRQDFSQSEFQRYHSGEYHNHGTVH